MIFKSSENGDSTAITKVACAVAFCIFTFAYLYCYQDDVLAVAQHALSNGQTHYSRLMGALLISLVLMLLQIGVRAFVGLNERHHALTYFPSMLVLMVITDINADIDLRFSFGAWLWVFPLLLALWGGIVYVLGRLLPPAAEVRAGMMLLPRRLWHNLLYLLVMALSVCLVGSSEDVFHYRAKSESFLLQQDFAGVLRVGGRSMATDADLTMIRCYALAREGKLGDELFKYPVQGSLSTIIPMEHGSRFLMYPVDSLYRYLGARPWPGMSVPLYLKSLAYSHKGNPVAVDYWLCGLLMERRLDDFVSLLRQYRSIDGSLPRHYREALILYTHLRSAPVVEYHDNVMDTDYEDLQKLEKGGKTSKFSCAKEAVFETYFGTYWWYYDHAGGK